jgi:hypothetical protein
MSIKKVAIIVEGQGELIFIRNVLPHIFPAVNYSFECHKLKSGTLERVPYDQPNMDADVHFKIINVGNDEKVLSYIKEYEESFFTSGFEHIIGLRDMYSTKYKKRSHEYDEALIKLFVDGTMETISGMSNPEKISFHFSIMEVESWWLSMYNLFAKLHSTLTNEFIYEKLNYSLRDINTESSFFHPANELTKILELADINYGKSISNVESITSNIDLQDIEEAMERERCPSFRDFYNSLVNSAVVN